MKKPVVVMFGGVSPEHEVSVITGLQIIENIDRNLYEPHAIYVNKSGEFLYQSGLMKRRDFSMSKGKPVVFGVNDKGGFLQLSGLINKKIHPYAVYTAFHGGVGENGAIQGMLETLGIPFTSTTSESAVLTMNKQLTKQMVQTAGINVVPGRSYLSLDVREKTEAIAREIITELKLPVILKPVHLGSSIGINIARTEVELEKYLLESAFVDREILVEKLINNFVEYNCAVRLIKGNIETSEIEKPMSKDEILSFADKYQRGGKKSGSGMASLQRELPAKIDKVTKERIQKMAKDAFVACRCKGMVRIDFMQDSKGSLYLTEINPIPGSVAFYLWEASGIPFKQQISDLVEQAVFDAELTKSTKFDHKTDIVEKFVAGN